MGKPRMYGMSSTVNPKQWRGQNDRKKHPRPREKATPVAGKLVKRKEGLA